MRQRATFYTALVVAVLGLCLGAADIAFAGTNAKGCTTKLFFPSDPLMAVGILCANPGCPEPCAVVPLGAGPPWTYVCGCPSNPGGAPFEYLVRDGNNCTTFVEWDGEDAWKLVCVPDKCFGACIVLVENLASGEAHSCQCPGGT